MQRDASHGAGCHGDHGAGQPAGGNVQGMEQSAACGSQHDRENDGSKFFHWTRSDISPLLSV
jgi:hypothetical protein